MFGQKQEDFDAAERAMEDLKAPRPVFTSRESIDAQTLLKQQVSDLKRPEYNVADLYYDSGCCQAIARSHVFEVVTLAVITLNALWISIDTDMNDAETLLDADWPFVLVDNFFCAYFFLEWLMRFLSFRRKLDGLKDGWFVFDSALLFTMVTETWVMTIILSLSSSAKSPPGLSNASILRILRLCRLTRMGKMAHLLSAMPEVMILVKGIAAATRGVVITLFVLTVLLYVAAVGFRQMTQGSDVGDEWFTSVPASMHTLLLHGTFQDDITGIARDLQDKAPLLLIPFYMYGLLSAITLMNMLIGILCEVVSNVATDETNSRTAAKVKAVFNNLMKNCAIDEDADGQISKAEFLGLLGNPKAVRVLETAGIDTVGLAGLADLFFEGEDGTENTLTHEGLMTIITDLRGTNTATVKDVVDLSKVVKTHFLAMDKKQEALEQYLRKGKPSLSRTLTSATTNGDQSSSDIRDTGRVPTLSKSLDLSSPLPSAQKVPQSPCLSTSSQTPARQWITWIPRGAKPEEVVQTQGISSCFQELTEQLLSSVESLHQHERAFADLRAENTRLATEITCLQESEEAQLLVPLTKSVEPQKPGRFNKCLEPHINL